MKNLQQDISIFLIIVKRNLHKNDQCDAVILACIESVIHDITDALEEMDLYVFLHYLASFSTWIFKHFFQQVVHTILYKTICKQ